MPAKYAIALDADVLDVLNRSLISEFALMLPPGNLERSLYVKVDKVLKAAGGKWNRSAKAHVFGSDPRKALGLAMETGSIVDDAKQKQQFFSPAAVAANLVTLADIRPGMMVLEPSAGGGAIAREARVAGANVICAELDTKLAAALEADNFEVIYGDFLTVVPAAQYDRVVMNPPFAKSQDINHVLHALKFLKPASQSVTAKLVSVMGAGIKTNAAKAATAFRALVDERGGYFLDMPADSFKESGTGVNTVIVVIPSGA